MGNTVGDTKDKWVVVGRLGKAHGVQGWVRLQSYTDPQTNITDYACFRTSGGKEVEELQVDQIARHGEGLIAHFKGYDSPEAARALTGRELQVAELELPELEPGEYYWHQLEGLRVINLQNQVLGSVERILETGANDVLLVQPGADSIDDRERLIPYLREQVVQSVDLEKGRIQVDWEADYLA